MRTDIFRAMCAGELTAHTGMSTKEVHMKYVVEEDAKLKKGAVPLHAVSESSFIMVGLQLEQTQ